MPQLIAATIGRLMPRYRTVDQWLVVYRQILVTRQLSPKTTANRENSLRYLSEAIGRRSIGGVRPHEIAAKVQAIHAVYPSTARKLMVDARDVFSEAVNYGWIDRNPAAGLKSPRAPVSRQRLTLEQWRAIHQVAIERLPPWVSRMLVLALVTGQRRSDLQAMAFDDVWDDRLHIVQVKTGARLALPLDLRLEAIGWSLREVIDDCLAYASRGSTLLRKASGGALSLASLSSRFEAARDLAVGVVDGYGAPSLHECRSLAERLYRKQGIDTRRLLGHKHQAMTDVYNDDRGLTSSAWEVLPLPATGTPSA